MRPITSARPAVALLAAAAVVAGGAVLTPSAASSSAAAVRSGAGPGAGTDEVVTWGASADRIAAPVTDQTVRNIVHTSIGGRALRVSLSNVFGSAPVTFDDVYVGRQGSGAAVAGSSNRHVTFSGSAAITVPAGAEVLSDPLGGRVPQRSNLAVSVHVQSADTTVTGHNLATQTSYVADGDRAADSSGAAFTSTISNWYWVDALVVDEPAQVDTVAALGDSITDGYASTPGANHRWPDYLARRILTTPGAPRYGIMNEGISGNKVLADGAGVSVQARFDRDVLSQPDVHTVVLLEGINDIGGGVATSADQLISAYRQLITRAHSDDTCILGGTITPYKGAGYFSPAGEQVRERANRWIRSSGEFDGVVDFDKATRDPQHPRVFLPAYDSGDHLHPNDAGYQAMAATVRLGQLRCDR
jgi:lysophospholipase L1-like esterase